MAPQNHVIDPTYFYDAIEEFAFNYDWYPVNKQTVDALGNRIYGYSKNTIHGSLQPRGLTWNQNTNLNTQEMEYRFFCKSLYRISIGDFIHYNNRWLIVKDFQDYDMWGVRSCTLQMVELSDHKDFNEYLKYLSGQTIV